MTAPGIPMRLADRPTVAGLVVPWISVQHHGGPVTFGAVHGPRVEICLRGRRCQICGTGLDDRIVLFARPRDLARGYVTEPAMHPECAAYAAKACPMVNGSMARHRAAPHDMGEPCGQPGCDCEGWIPSDDRDKRLAAAAEAWFAMWLQLANCRLATGDNGVSLGISVKDVSPLKLRPLNDLARQQQQMLTAVVAARDLLGLEVTR